MNFPSDGEVIGCAEFEFEMNWLRDNTARYLLTALDLFELGVSGLCYSLKSFSGGLDYGGAAFSVGRYFRGWFT